MLLTSGGAQHVQNAAAAAAAARIIAAHVPRRLACDHQLISALICQIIHFYAAAAARGPLLIGVCRPSWRARAFAA